MVREAVIPTLHLDGRLMSKTTREQVNDRISAITEKAGDKVPGLGIIMANGLTPFFGTYERCNKRGIMSKATIRSPSFSCICNIWYGLWFDFPLEVTGECGGSSD